MPRLSQKADRAAWLISIPQNEGVRAGAGFEFRMRSRRSLITSKPSVIT